MTPQMLHLRARPLPHEIAAVRSIPREDARWIRPVFRPPPLQVNPGRPDFRYLGTIQRTEPWALPARDDPSFDEAAAAALLEGARVSEVLEAEEATGYAWGAARLRPFVERALERARREKDDRLEQVAERFLKHAL